MNIQGKDDKATKEAAAFASRNLDEESQVNDHERKQKRKEHQNNLSIKIMWILVIVIGISSIIWLWHLLAPCGWRWLNQQDFNQLQTILFSGVISSILSIFIKENI